MSGHNKSSEDSIMDAYYRLIGAAHIDNIVQELEKDKNDIDKMTVPKSLDDWFDSFEQRRKKISNRKKWLNRIRKLSSRVAVFLVISIVCMAAITMSVEAFRIRFFNFIIDVKDNYTEIDKREDLSNQEVPDIEGENFFYLSYLPTGYSFKNYDIVGDSLFIQYSSDEETIIFIQGKGEANYQLDTEGAEIKAVPIGEGSGQLILKDARIMLFWSINEYSFLLKATISEKEIIKMAENIKKK